MRDLGLVVGNVVGFWWGDEGGGKDAGTTQRSVMLPWHMYDLRRRNGGGGRGGSKGGEWRLQRGSGQSMCPL